MSFNFRIQSDEARMFGPTLFFLLNSENLGLLSEKFEFMSEKSRGNVREFWSS